MKVNDDMMDIDDDKGRNYTFEELERKKYYELEQRNIELEADNKKISNELNICSKEKDDLRSKLDNSEDRANGISEKYNQSKKNLEALRIENQRLINEHKDYTEICKENKDLKYQLSSLSTVNKKLGTEINKLHDNLSIENTKLKKMQTDYTAKCNENVTLNAQIERLKKIQTDYTAKCKENEKLKAHLENEKLKNNKQANHSAVYNDNANLKVQLKELKKNLSTLRTDKEVLTSKFTDSDNKNKILNDNYSTIHNENEKLKNQLKELEGKLKEKSKYDQLTTEKFKNGEIFKDGVQNNEVQNKNEEYIKEINQFKNLLKQREKEKQDLIVKNNNLKKEASQYQSALGTVTNYRMDDDDKNHSVHLKEDIEELQTKLKNYVTTLKGDFEIDFNAVNVLMEKYNIKAKVTPKNPNKPLIRAVLQYHVLKKIIKYKDDYFKKNSKTGNEMHLEAEIVSKAKDLEGLLARFSETRDGNDTITQTASIKIRQEVNIALGNRGFSKTLCENNTSTDHVFIILNKNNLNKEMNKYRIIKDETKRVYVEKLASDLIREFIRIVQFRLKVQEPSAQLRWVKVDANIDPSIMEGSWDKDDIDNLLVEVCYFPMIGRDLDNEEKRKIYTHAQVSTKRKKFLGNVKKGLNNIWSIKNKGNLEPVSDDDEVE
ncbi:hypothetical protein RclHR1_00260021 [Rhizophagus clarus]|uniref:Uncharacterized protein n=1 Tax=Rhizophagus clarus TaxID=94130 RepID=A0A2Z6RUH4_9GLOM|nr:hypothetical protein RclHR1_00260021 [Rhizophagus clarus]GES97269.1 hypothetical protein GLOIN_2v1678993 [Rhizophagus clarus]